MHALLEAMKQARPTMSIPEMYDAIMLTTGRSRTASINLTRSSNPTSETLVSIAHSLDVSPELMMHLLVAIWYRDSSTMPANFLVPKCKGANRRVSAERMVQSKKAEARRVLREVAEAI